MILSRLVGVVMIANMLHGIKYGGNAVVEYTVRDVTKTIRLDQIGLFFDSIPFDDGKDDQRNRDDGDDD